MLLPCIRLEKCRSSWPVTTENDTWQSGHCPRDIQSSTLIQSQDLFLEIDVYIKKMARDYFSMPGFQDARDEYSNLERFQDDDTVRAPEPRNAGLDCAAPELDTARLAPEVSRWP